MDVLLRIGMPASAKGVTYICDAMELFDTDPYYPEGKICALYADIARLHGTTSSRVERAIRHAFGTAIERGRGDMVEQYLDSVNTQNANLLKTLYFRLNQDKRKRQEDVRCDSEHCTLKRQIYMEAMDVFSAEMTGVLTKILENISCEGEIAAKE